ncbi:MAG: SOS response-associated peptidase [Salinarimonadaceae bacterium]|nr:MAG: SOS response-associated peptidase [Salinarimonadaceae bacterium]
MCGRYAVTLAPEVYRAFYGYEDQPNFPPRFNIAPTQPVAVVVSDGGARRFRLMRWGFLPGWVKEPKGFPLLINARSETVAEKPAFRAAARRRRCVFLADAFFEWRRDGAEKIPFAIRMRDGGPMPVAGLWETWSDPQSGELDTAAIVTTDANGLLAAIHDRMPVILQPDDLDAWLDPEARIEEALALTRPCEPERLTMFEVSRRVNRVANDDASLLEPVAGEAPVPAARKAKPPEESGQGSLF